MNAAQLYDGELYAYFEDPPRGRTPLGAAKVRLRGSETRKSTWDTNRRTYAMVTVVEPGNIEGSYSRGLHTRVRVGQELTVPARHLIDFWSDYEAEANLLRQERDERKTKARRHALREQVISSLVTWKLQHEKGIHIPIAILDVYEDGSGFVKFQLKEIMDWLEIDPEAIEEKIDELMEA